jgi:hypothetical protein
MQPTGLQGSVQRRVRRRVCAECPHRRSGTPIPATSRLEPTRFRAGVPVRLLILHTAAVRCTAELTHPRCLVVHPNLSRKASTCARWRLKIIQPSTLSFSISAAVSLLLRRSLNPMLCRSTRNIFTSYALARWNSSNLKQSQPALFHSFLRI